MEETYVFNVSQQKLKENLTKLYWAGPGKYLGGQPRVLLQLTHCLQGVGLILFSRRGMGRVVFYKWARGAGGRVYIRAKSVKMTGY
jgi:hypothetical protein